MDVAEELTEFEDRIDRGHIERRIEDWDVRLRALYDDLCRWLPSDWSGEQRRDVAMNEPLMRVFSVKERRLPSLVLTRHDASVRLEPRGLWIVGTNGRVDLVSRKRHDLLVDRADLYDPPRWTISSFDDQLHPQPLTRERFVESLS